MPKFVTNPLKNATTAGVENSIEQMRARRTGQWGQVPPEDTAAYKASQLALAKKQAVRGGQYFPNNVVERQVAKTKANRERFMGILDQIRSQQ